MVSAFVFLPSEVFYKGKLFEQIVVSEKKPSGCAETGLWLVKKGESKPI